MCERARNFVSSSFRVSSMLLVRPGGTPLEPHKVVLSCSSEDPVDRSEGAFWLQKFHWSSLDAANLTHGNGLHAG